METQEKKPIGMSVEEKDNSHSGEMNEKTERITGTILVKKWDKDNGWSYGIPGYRISKWYETEEEMMENIENPSWNEIGGLIGAMIDGTLKLNNIIK